MASIKSKFIKILAEFITVFHRTHPIHKEFNQVIKDLLYLLNTDLNKNSYFVTELGEKLKKSQEFANFNYASFSSEHIKPLALSQLKLHHLNMDFSKLISTLSEYNNEEIIDHCQNAIFECMVTIVEFLPHSMSNDFYRNYIYDGFRPAQDIKESKVFSGLLIKIHYLNKYLMEILEENFSSVENDDLIKIKEIINFIKYELEDATARHLNLCYSDSQSGQSFWAIMPLYQSLSRTALEILASVVAMEKAPKERTQILTDLSQKLEEIVPMPQPQAASTKSEKLVLKIGETEIQSFADLDACYTKDPYTVRALFSSSKNLPLIANLFSNIDQIFKFSPQEIHNIVKLIRNQPTIFIKFFISYDHVVKFHKDMWTSFEETDLIRSDDIYEISRFLLEKSPIVFQSADELMHAIQFSLNFGNPCQSNFVELHLDQIVSFFNNVDKFIELIKLNINDELIGKLIIRLPEVKTELLNSPEIIPTLMQHSEELSLTLLKDLGNMAPAIFCTAENVLLAFEKSGKVANFLCQNYSKHIISMITSFEVFLKMVNTRSSAVQFLIQADPSFFSNFFDSPINSIEILNKTTQIQHITHSLLASMPSMDRHLAIALAFSKRFFKVGLINSIFKSAIKLQDIKTANRIIQTSLELENIEILNFSRKTLNNTDGYIKKKFAKIFEKDLTKINDYTNPFKYAVLTDLLQIANSNVPSLKILAAKAVLSPVTASENVYGMFFHKESEARISIPAEIMELITEAQQNDNNVTFAVDDDGEKYFNTLISHLSYSS